MDHTRLTLRTRRTASIRKLVAGAVAAAGLTAAGLAGAATAGAVVVSPVSDAAAETAGVCVTNSFTGNRLMKVAVGQYDFEYSRTYILDWATGAGYWGNWSTITGGNSSFTQVTSGWQAMYIEFADWSPTYGWLLQGEWVYFNTGWWCG